jgi:hypothetical protein
MGVGWAADGALPGTHRDDRLGDRLRRLRRPNPPESRDAAVAPEATQSHAREGCEAGFLVEHAFSASDDPDLVGFSDSVFGGRVAERVGTTAAKLGGMPADSTRFSVEVLKNVKGRLGGVVTVGQEGAYDPKRGCTMFMEDDPLLEPGQEVVLFTRRDEGRGWHQIVSAGYGDVSIEDKQHREELVRRFERAEKHQTDPLR